MKKWLSSFVMGMFNRKAKLKEGKVSNTEIINVEIYKIEGSKEKQKEIEQDIFNGIKNTVVLAKEPVIKQEVPECKHSKELRKLYYLSTRVKPRVKKKIIKRIIKLKKLGN